MSLHALQFAALGDPTRCRIVELLAQDSQPVHALAGRFDISRPAISRHLRVLREAGIVREEKVGRENVYALRREQLDPALAWIGRIVPATGVAAAPPMPAPKAMPAKVRTPVMPPAPARHGQMEFDL